MAIFDLFFTLYPIFSLKNFIMTQKKKAVSREWPAVLDHAEHVKKILIDNNQTAFVGTWLNPLFDAHERGVRSSKLKAMFEIALQHAQDEFSNLFFDNEPA